jgi:hypothetical protein
MVLLHPRKNSASRDERFVMKNLIASLVCLSVLSAAQTPPAFEVASIKPSNYSGGPLRVTGRVDADGINFSNVTLRACIQRAYNVKPYQITGPAWTTTDRYMIVAKAAGAEPESRILLMLQSLPAERFKLVFHREAREMPVYALVVLKNGPKLQAATGDGATQIGDGDAVTFVQASMDSLAGVLARAWTGPCRTARASRVGTISSSGGRRTTAAGQRAHSRAMHRPLSRH